TPHPFPAITSSPLEYSIIFPRRQVVIVVTRCRRRGAGQFVLSAARLAVELLIQREESLAGSVVKHLGPQKHQIRRAGTAPSILECQIGDYNLVIELMVPNFPPSPVFFIVPWFLQNWSLVFSPAAFTPRLPKTPTDAESRRRPSPALLSLYEKPQFVLRPELQGLPLDVQFSLRVCGTDVPKLRSAFLSDRRSPAVVRGRGGRRHRKRRAVKAKRWEIFFMLHMSWWCYCQFNFFPS
ncbi:unnamed protein product, partial [Linum tenue]